MKHIIRCLGIIMLAASLYFTACDDNSGSDVVAPDIEVLFLGAEQIGGTSGTANSTGLTLAFDVDPATLTADHN